ncbi:serine carboxypeptidase S28-domain-containing protein [Lophiotrema nucula]|uniref:Serine carboxypeptidase S28-domain-containing protein n=1 Tax=Lophiotrema nucula TaxID=690887 RepID=A0A6A5ZJP7_9PLEO|nr:serine carboxypeptidase S28-domain-containing protein [Lophiotrema nucula]
MKPIIASALFFTSLFTPIALSQAPPPCDYKTFTQSIDHFGTNNNTFQQRYSIFTEHFKPGGPILYFIGEESTYLDCANDTILYWMAEELGGMAVSLEHRYFGNSLPFGNASMEVKNVKYLTLENVMADGVAFVEWLRTSVPGAQDSKVVIASGSYGAYISTAMRQNHPSTFFAAISSAAPVRGFIRADNSSNGHNPDYTLQAFLIASFEATMKIRNAFTVMHDAIRAGNGDTVQKALNLCTSPPNNESVIAVLDQIYDTAITLTLQFDYAQSRPGRIPIAHSFDLMLNHSIASSEPLDILEYALSLFMGDDPLPCVNWTDFPSIVILLSPVIQRQTFSYITCAYNPNAVGTMGHPRVFANNPHALLSWTSVIESCKKTYNVTPLTEDVVWSRFKISPKDLDISTRIIFSNAEYDPTSGQAPPAVPLSDDVCQSRVLWTNGMGHREDLFAPEEGDKIEVVKTREKELEILKTWLALCEDD